MKASDFNMMAGLESADGATRSHESITRTSRVGALLSVNWQSSHATHIDRRYVDNINVWRDYFPAELETRLEGCSIGETLSHCYEPGEALPEFSAAQIHKVKQQQFNRNFSSQISLEPRLGRFYPRGIFENIAGNYRSNYQPCRIIDLDDDSITTDFNHPLAGHTIEFEVEILSVAPPQ